MSGGRANMGVVLGVGALLLAAITLLSPLAWMVRTSLMTHAEATAVPPPVLPETPQWGNYAQALSLVPFLRFMLNSLVMTGATVLLQLAICSTAAYAFARLRFPGRRRLFGLYLATLMVPPVVTLIPAFLLIVDLGWRDTYAALIAPYASSVWGIFLLRQFFAGLPRELEDAARIDGAGELTIFLRIILPLSKPALATLAVFAATSTWQQFLWPLIVTDRMDMRPVSVGISLFASLHERQPHFQMAAAVMAVVPVLVLFVMAQKYLVRGISMTGMKG